jgi:hypothetical protein
MRNVFFPAILLIPTLLAACGGGLLVPEHCADDAACPSEAPGDCERWACTESTLTDPRSGVQGCQPVPLADGAACDNGNAACTGHCAKSACVVDVSPLPSECAHVSDGGAQ